MMSLLLWVFERKKWDLIQVSCFPRFPVTGCILGAKANYSPAEL